MTDLNELRRLVQAATPGGWYVEHGNYVYGCKDVTDGEEEWHPVIACTDDNEPVNFDGNAAFIAAANPAAITELLDRLEAAESDALEQARLNGMGASREAALLTKLEAAEKERDFAKVEIARLHDDIHELIDEREALRAKIEAMERQEPVAEIGQQYTLLFVGGGSITGIVERHGIKVGDKLYALPGAKGEKDV